MQISDETLDAVERALLAAPIPSKFGNGLGEYNRLAEAVDDWRTDHVRPALARLRAERTADE